MTALLRFAASKFPRLAALFGLMLLAACGPMDLGLGRNVKVALLVPGESERPGDQVLADSLKNAALLAASDLEGVEIELRVYYTRGTPAGAAEAAKLAADDGAKILLGPVFAESAAAAGVAVQGRGLNVLAFSNNPTIAGGNVFILGHTFQNTANRLVSYAASRELNNIYVAYADESSEIAGRDAIVRAISANRTRLAGSTGFELSQDGVINTVPIIAEEAQRSSADAIFLTSGTSGALPFLSQLLPENGLDPEETRYIGLQRWDVPSTALSLPGLQGGWFAVPDPGLAQQFAARYRAAYGGDPHPIAGLAYDGIAAIGALASTGRGDAFGKASLTQPAGFAGVNGVFRFLPDGTNERGLAVAEIRNNELMVIDPAPRSFSGPGF
ncbi:MAG: penicillin-binding protein activator [Rhodobacteraceae bacterium]|nr:penicillin-binding protein activator [Paracoccaceae bacterium]